MSKKTVMPKKIVTFTNNISLLIILVLLSTTIALTQGLVTANSGNTINQAFSLTSTAFSDGGTIPDKYAYNEPGQCSGQNFSPPLSWTGAPAGTQSFVLLVDDPDFGFAHWVMFDIPADTTSLAETKNGPSVGVDGNNDWGQLGYGGPCPPEGTGIHTYRFELYALSVTSLSLPEGSGKVEVETALVDSTLGKATLSGKYQYMDPSQTPEHLIYLPLILTVGDNNASTPTPTATLTATPPPTATIPNEETATPTVTATLTATPTATATIPNEETATPTPTAPGGTPQVGIVAQLKDYEVLRHGYGFQNYSNDAGRNWQDDLSAADLFRMFGAAVCESGTTAADCVLTAPAKQWLEEELKGMDGGHCEGMAVTSLRFWQNKTFNGKTTASDFQNGAATVTDLTFPEQSIENYIAYYFVTQSFDEVAIPSQQTRIAPSAILDMLIASMKDGTDPYTLGIYQYKNGDLTAGHAITPYAVEYLGGDKYKVHIYDNNFPKQTTYMDIDKANDTWVYYTAATPGDDPDKYEGNAETKSLEITLQSLRDPAKPFTCPFCQGNGTARQATGQTVEFNLTGEGAILVTNDEGQRIGYDFSTDKFINEITGSTVTPFKGGLGKNIPSSLRLPFQQDDTPYQVLISGKSITTEVDADLSMTGPGYVVGFEGILLDPNEDILIDISPSGQQVVYNASQDAETPLMFIAFDPDEEGASYIFEVGSMEILAGQTVTVTLDFDAGQLYFEDDDGNADNYDLLIIRVNSDGTEDVYQQNDLDIGDADSYSLNFANWSGNGGEICFMDDDNGDGFADETCENQPDEN